MFNKKMHKFSIASAILSEIFFKLADISRSYDNFLGVHTLSGYSVCGVHLLPINSKLLYFHPMGKGTSCECCTHSVAIT